MVYELIISIIVFNRLIPESVKIPTARQFFLEAVLDYREPVVDEQLSTLESSDGKSIEDIFDDIFADVAQLSPTDFNISLTR